MLKLVIYTNTTGAWAVKHTSFTKTHSRSVAYLEVFANSVSTEDGYQVFTTRLHYPGVEDSSVFFLYVRGLEF